MDFPMSERSEIYFCCMLWAWEPLWLFLSTSWLRDPGLSDRWLYWVPWRPADSLHSANNEHRTMACRTTDGHIRKAQEELSQLVPPTVNPKPHSRRGWQMQNSVNTMPLKTQDFTLTLCPRICATNFIHLFQEEYPERKTKSTSF